MWGEQQGAGSEQHGKQPFWIPGREERAGPWSVKGGGTLVKSIGRARSQCPGVPEEGLLGLGQHPACQSNGRQHPQGRVRRSRRVSGLKWLLGKGSSTPYERGSLGGGGEPTLLDTAEHSEERQAVGSESVLVPGEQLTKPKSQLHL